MDLTPVLRAHSFLHVEQPPVLWGIAADLETLVRTLGEMIAAALARGTQLGEVVLRANNVTIETEPTADEPPRPPSPGDYVAVSILGGGDWQPEVIWSPTLSDCPLLVNPDLDAAARAARVPFAYTRQIREVGSVTIFLERAAM